MRIKEKILRKSIKCCENEIAKIDKVLNADPASELLKVWKEAQQIFDENKGDYKTIARLMEPLGKREKALKVELSMQIDSSKLIKRKVKLESELCELKNELYFHERKYGVAV